MTPKQSLPDATGQAGGAKKKVFIAMSGGVDSSVAALLLKRQGYDVTGVLMKNWDNCDWQNEKRWAHKVALELNIPFVVWNFTKEYNNKVLKNFYDEYKNGRTPNPDILCNKEIKFGLFLKKALSLGADYIATGHHVKNQKSKIKNQNFNSKVKTVYTLHRGRDENKDQSYFLWTLTQEQLKHSLFPIGDYIKADVRKMAKRAGLSNYNKKDSQGLCFVGKIKLKEFLENKVPRLRGKIISNKGKILGEHGGYHFYTNGQREGLKIGGQKLPLYVAHRDSSSNTIVAVDRKSELLYTKKVLLKDIHFISGEPEREGKFTVKIRYRQPDQKANLTKENGQYVLLFDEPQFAVSVGQSAVLYKQDEIIGGGIIDMVEKPQELLQNIVNSVQQ